MKYKTPDIEVAWKGSVPKLLRALLKMADEYRLLLDGQEVTITSYLRPPDPAKFSFHSEGKAVDVRTHDMTERTLRDFTEFLAETAGLLNKRFQVSAGASIQVVLHPELRGTDNAHIHIELDDRVLKPKGTI